METGFIGAAEILGDYSFGRLFDAIRLECNGVIFIKNVLREKLNGVYIECNSSFDIVC